MSVARGKDTTWQFVYDDLPIDISGLIEEVSNFDLEWKLDVSRQKNKTHRNTEMFQLRFIDYLWSTGDGDNSKNINKMKTEISNSCINQIYEYLENIYDGKIVRSEIVKMLKNTNIRKHVDGGEFLTVARRIHIPLITNKSVIFSVFNKEINMEVGKWYEINNVLPHSVDNLSDMDRVHLIVDILPNKALDHIKNI